ncbi:hypothetical protein LL273_13885 [Marinobacter salarius]|uniref:hypothetical protein n=1 Tax=Marinobacter salarius TaxID=1420917 RepID=UPI001D1808A6|nr:hypothetical protein [Marinobacter salarius]MCC4284817.1 hypothetical protein [Marinobacter salarius]
MFSKKVLVALIFWGLSMTAIASTPPQQFQMIHMAEELVFFSGADFMNEPRSPESIFIPLEALSKALPNYSVVSLALFSSDLRNNELAAEMKYPAGLVTTGIVNSVYRASGRPVVDLVAPAPSRTEGKVHAQAIFNEGSERLLVNIERGAGLTIACKEWRSARHTELKDCQLIGEAWNQLFNWELYVKALKNACKANRAILFPIILHRAAQMAGPEVVRQFVDDQMKDSVFLTRARVANNSEASRDLFGKYAAKASKEVSDKEVTCDDFDALL